MHLVVTEYQGASLGCQSLQLLPGVTTLMCEPPQLPKEVSGECQRVSLVWTLRAGLQYMVFLVETLLSVFSSLFGLV
jgi:hypothetical protein